MASHVPPTTAAQPKSLLAQQDKRLLRRLAVWGGAAGLSLAVAVFVSQTGSGSRRLQAALFDSVYAPDIPVATAVALPPAELIAVTRATEAVKRTTEAVKRVTDRTAAKLEVVERNTEAARAETRRLALQINKLSADSFRVTGRLVNIENRIDGITGSIKSITGSIKQQAEEAAAAAVAKAMPPKPAYNKAFDMTAPIISPPATTYPKLSLIMPPAPGSASSPTTAEASATERGSGPDVTTTSAITTTPNGKPKDQTRIGTNVAQASKPMVKGVPQAEELKAEAGPKVMSQGKQQIAIEPEARPMAKPAGRSAQPAPPVKMANAATPRRRYSRHWVPQRGYGIDLGGAESVTIAKAQWAAVKANFGPMLVGMRPIVVRNHRLLTTGDYRLIAGRTHSLANAERLCKRLALQQVICQPIKFEDGRMVWR